MASKSRQEMDQRFQWRLEDIYPSQEAWEAAYNQARDSLETLRALPGTLSRSREALKEGLDRIYAVLEPVERLYLYANLKKCGDNGDPEAQTLEGRARNLYVELSTAVSFLDPEILTIPPETLRTWMADPMLSEYRHLLEDTDRRRAHTLPAEQEALLSRLSDAAGTPDAAFTMLESVDLSFPDIPGENGEMLPLTHGTFARYKESRNPALRRTAHETYHGQFRAHINTLAALYSGQVKLDNFYAQARGYDSACQMSLSGSNVPLSVYDSLVSAVHDGIPSLEAYLRLRKTVLGLDTLHMYDLSCPMVEDVDYQVDYDTAKAIVKEALRPLGEEYQALLDRAFREQWMDVYENKGKTTGAFSCGVYGVHPFVLLNFTGSLEDVFTMAHELGHAMHSYRSDAANSYANHDYKLLVAEVASTVNEVLLTKYLLRTETDPRRRAYILAHFAQGFNSTVYRQTLFAEFEREAHDRSQAGEPLTAQVLSQLYHDLDTRYYPGVEIDPYQDVEWARVPHFYSAFYVYVYATGFCSAVDIASRILETGDPSEYLRFLSTGGSDYPIEELKIAGVDLTSPQVVRRALQVFHSTVEELTALLETL